MNVRISRMTAKHMIANRGERGAEETTQFDTKIKVKVLNEMSRVRVT